MVDLLEPLDGFAGLRNGLRHIAELREDWAGIPMPLDGRPLIVEPTYPKAKELMSISRSDAPDVTIDDEPASGARIRNRFWSHKKGREVVIFEQDGRVDWGTQGHVNGARFLLHTLEASVAWGIEQEARAVQTLASILRHAQFKSYLLTGMFMEQSRRSGLFYLFRRLRPTLAISTCWGTAEARIIAALCLHPIAYYEESWAGAMTPSDDILAHLLLMRGDEVMLWRRANQHAAWRPEAGL